MNSLILERNSFRAHLAPVGLQQREDLTAAAWGTYELPQTLGVQRETEREGRDIKREQGELFFSSGQCRDAQIGKIEGDDAVYKVILWTEGEFEIDFNAATASTRTTTTRGTTGLLMEAMRLMDESSRNAVETPNA